MEASAENNTGNKKRSQAHCLHEVCLIYFRVVKLKIGFSLLPAALSGLSRITHLMNIDMVQDLMTLLKSTLEQQSPAPVTWIVNCAAA